MGSHPINLAIRFLLEIIAFVSIGIWGWNQSDNWFRYLLAIGLPLMFAIIWGTFAVPNDPSRSGKAPVKTPGFIRLLIELGIFSSAIYCLYIVGYIDESIIFGAITTTHYIVSYDRIFWLIRQT